MNCVRIQKPTLLRVDKAKNLIVLRLYHLIFPVRNPTIALAVTNKLSEKQASKDRRHSSQRKFTTCDFEESCNVTT